MVRDALSRNMSAAVRFKSLYSTGFWGWLRRQRNRTDSVGGLARYLGINRRFWNGDTAADALGFLRRTGAGEGLMEAFGLALAEFAERGSDAESVTRDGWAV